MDKDRSKLLSFHLRPSTSLSEEAGLHLLPGLISSITESGTESSRQSFSKSWAQRDSNLVFVCKTALLALGYFFFDAVYNISKTMMSLKASFLVTLGLGWLIHQAAGQCIADETINAEFASFLDGYSTTTTEEDLAAAGTCW